MFQHDAAHTGYSSSSLPASLVHLWDKSPFSWSGTDERYFISNVAVAQNCVYFIWGDKICALNASNGQLVWSSPSSSSETDIGTDIIYECPAVVDGYVYTKFCAYNASTGQLMLNYTSNDAYGSPTVADGVLLINTNFGNQFGPDGLIALNAKTGVKMWDFNEDGNGHMPGFMNHPPAIANGVVYFPCASGVYALNLQTGAQIWRVPINGFSGYTTFAEGNVYCALNRNGYFGPGVFYCFDASTGHSKWTCQTHFAYQPSVAKGIVYTYSTALNASTGKAIWNSTLLTGSQVIAGGIVYSMDARLTSDGHDSIYEMYALNASTGNEEGNYTFGSTSTYLTIPAIVNGTLYLSENGEFWASGVFCFGSAPPSSNSPPEPTSTPNQEPSLDIAVTAVIIAFIVVSVGLLIYFKKRKH
jgi:outer membrane protein assembly factor BamB